MKRLLLILFFALSSCVNKETKDQPTSQTMSRAEWQMEMRKVGQSFSTILPFVFRSGAFSAPENHEQILENLQSLAKSTRELHFHKIKFDNDPILEYVARDFNQSSTLARDEFKRGNKSFARLLILNTSNYCISCHTRNDQGTRNVALFAEPNLATLRPIEKGNYFTAIRQYDKALDEFDHALTNKEFSEQFPREWLGGIKKTLAIAVRVNRNPGVALEAVSRINDAKSVPQSTKEFAVVWRAAIKEWQKNNEPVGAATLTVAKQLIEKGQSLNYKMASPEAGLVHFLRASTLLHDYLNQKKRAKLYVEAMYLAGMAAEGLKEINLWTFDEYYYEACVRTAPHSEMAKKCFTRYESLSVFSNKYLDDQSLVPTSVMDKVNDLRKLAL